MNKTDNKKIEKYKKSGNFQLAIDICKAAISKEEDNADLHIKLGDLYLERHMDISQNQQWADEAITEYQRALELCVDCAEVYYKIGMAFFTKRELDKALNYFKLTLEKNRKFNNANFMIAQIFQQKGDYIGAIEYAKYVIKNAPFRSAKAYRLIYRILSLFSKRRKIVIEKCYYWCMSWLTLPFDSEAIKSFFKNFSYLKYYFVIKKINLLIRFKGYTQEVIDLYRETIDKAPRYAALYVNLGRLYFDLQRYDDAICEYKMAIWLDSLNVQAYYCLCQVYEEQKDFENAVLICQKLIELQPHIADFHSKMAQYAYLMGDVEMAVEHYQTAITLNPKSEWTSIVSQTLGFIFQENTKDLDAAIAAFQNAYNLTPNDIDVYLQLGNVFFEKGSYDNALVVYKKALEMSPYNARLHCNLGYLYWGKGNIEEAIKEYEKAITYDSTYDIAYNNLGVIYLDDLGEVSKAIELFEAARKYNPNYALANYNLARSIAIKGDKIEAAKLYQLAKEINTYTQEMDPLDIQEKIQDLFT